MVREVLLDRIEELALGSARELRPALAMGDPPMPLDDRCAVVAIRPSLTCPPGRGRLV
jgi:hypothetical protein